MEGAGRAGGVELSVAERVYAHIHTYIRIHMYIYTYTYMYIHIYIYIRLRVQGEGYASGVELPVAERSHEEAQPEERLGSSTLFARRAGMLLRAKINQYGASEYSQNRRSPPFGLFGLP